MTFLPADPALSRSIEYGVVPSSQDSGMSPARQGDDETSLARHGDDDVRPGMLDFAVNVRGAAPEWMQSRLRARIGDLSAYPSPSDLRRATEAVAAAHGRHADEVVPLAGAAEGFALLAALRPRKVAVLAPSFTEPERVLRSAQVPVERVAVSPPWRLSDADVPEDADVVILGNPTNPTSVLHRRAEIEALRRPGRLVVVDEAFADLTLAVDDAGVAVHEPESMSGRTTEDLIVIRSVTKTFGLAGLRAGYLLAAPTVIARLVAGRPHWPVGTLTLTAIELALGPRGRAYARGQAEAVVRERDAMLSRLAAVGVEVCGSPAASFVLTRVREGARVGRALAERGVAVRGCASFPGLTADHIRLAVRDREAVTALLHAWTEIGR